MLGHHITHQERMEDHISFLSCMVTSKHMQLTPWLVMAVCLLYIAQSECTSSLIATINNPFRVLHKEYSLTNLWCLRGLKSHVNWHTCENYRGSNTYTLSTQLLANQNKRMVTCCILLCHYTPLMYLKPSHLDNMQTYSHSFYCTHVQWPPRYLLTYLPSSNNKLIIHT